MAGKLEHARCAPDRTPPGGRRSVSRPRWFKFNGHNEFTLVAGPIASQVMLHREGAIGMAEENDEDAHLLPPSPVSNVGSTFCNGLDLNPRLIATDVAGEAVMAPPQGDFSAGGQGYRRGQDPRGGAGCHSYGFGYACPAGAPDRRAHRAEARRILRIVMDHFEGEGRQAGHAY